MIPPLVAEGISLDNVQLDKLIAQLIEMGVSAGKHILAAALLFFVGRYVVKIINRIVAKLLRRDTIDPSVQTFLGSMVNILLTVLLIISVIGALGVNTTSFAALLASAGVAIGMALSGNLQNFAGGLVILLFKPYKVGDWIEAQGQQGKVLEIQIFHTIIQTTDLRRIYIPNGSMSTTLVVNHSQEAVRRAQWTVSVQYGCDIAYARNLLLECLKAEPRILPAPADPLGAPLQPYFVEVDSLAASSVDFTVRAYVNNADYWPVIFHMREVFYDAVSRDPKLDIPFKTQTVHIVNDTADAEK